MKLKILLFILVASSIAAAQNKPASPPSTTPQIPKVDIYMEVTATREAEDPQTVPTGIQVISGEELRIHGARDLHSALSQAEGVEIAPGGDAGPASSVPEFWGLKELDAFLLVVDGVPWGGAFNPALTSLDLSDVDRIEILRGPAPITYGATSFVGVIQVVHTKTDSKDRTLFLHGGSFKSGGFDFATPIPLPKDWSSRLSVGVNREGFRDDRTNFRQYHGLWRVNHKASDTSRFWFNADMNWLDQSPASARIRDGATLSPDNPVDANYNPAGAFLNDHRGSLMAGFDHAILGGEWSTTGSFSHNRNDRFRGFVTDLSNTPDNATGFRQQIHLTDVYFDSHVSWKLRNNTVFILGTDYLHGTGNEKGIDFDYTVPVNGAVATIVPMPTVLDVKIHDQRDFVGPYASVEWRPLERVRIDAGVRLNVTHENQSNEDPGAPPPLVLKVTRTDVRAGANLGAIISVWQKNNDSVRLYVNYRDTFKPAAIDFGLERNGGTLILKPETSRSVEGGIKTRLYNGRMEAEASGFLMDFNNLVTPVSIAGVPSLINAGSQRFKGFETGTSFFLQHDILAHASYSYHDARFTNFIQDFGGVPTQLAGKRLEMSANHLAAMSLFYAPAHGFLGGVDFNYTGARFLNKRNTAPASGFPTVDMGVGYRDERWEVRVNARNLGDRRDPVAESELGDAQYYLINSRRVDVGLKFHF